MKTPGLDKSNGFTLIELLAVIAIIALLASSIVVAVGYFARRATKSRTQSILMMVECGITAFHDDYGVYPPEYRNSWNARFLANEGNDAGIPNPFNHPDYEPVYQFAGEDETGFNSDIDYASEMLYQVLFKRFDLDDSGQPQQVMDDMPRKSAYIELPGYAVRETGTNDFTEIVDAWGNPILYVAKDRYVFDNHPPADEPGPLTDANIEPHEDKNGNTFSLYSYGSDGLGYYEADGGTPPIPEYPVQHKTISDIPAMRNAITSKYGNLDPGTNKANKDNVINW